METHEILISIGGLGGLVSLISLLSYIFPKKARVIKLETELKGLQKYYNGNIKEIKDDIKYIKKMLNRKEKKNG